MFGTIFESLAPPFKRWKGNILYTLYIMAKTRRVGKGRKRCGEKYGGSRKPKYNMKGCASKRRGAMSKEMYGGDEPIAPLSLNQMNAMRGGSCPSCSLPSSYQSISGIGQTGGCTSCMRGGGSGYKTDLAPVVPPFVGKAWGPLVSQWPGVNSSRNFFTNNLYKVDPQTMMKLGGTKGKGKGKRKRMKQKSRRSKSVCNGICGPDCICTKYPAKECDCSPECQCGCQKKALKGGSILPDFVGLGRDLMYNFQSTYNSLNGYNQPMNPKPYIQPALSSTKPI